MGLIPADCLRWGLLGGTANQDLTEDVLAACQRPWWPRTHQHAGRCARLSRERTRPRPGQGFILYPACKRQGLYEGERQPPRERKHNQWRGCRERGWLDYLSGHVGQCRLSMAINHPRVNNARRPTASRASQREELPDQKHQPGPYVMPQSPLTHALFPTRSPRM